MAHSSTQERVRSHTDSDCVTPLMPITSRRLTTPLVVGLFFSLGHSSIVLAMSVAVAFAAKTAIRFQHSYAALGGVIGASVSGFFLYLVGILNLVILVGIIKVWRQAKSGQFSHEHLEQMLNDRGLIKRLFKGRFARGFDHSWQLYPIGLLFGLGFDTATEVALLALSATAAIGTVGGTLPPLAIIALPLIFGAGMSLMDSLDGIFMIKAYSWAFTSPLRKIYYNLTTTGLSIFVALVIGTIELVSVIASKTSLGAHEPFKSIASVNLGSLGFFIVASFVGAWVLSVTIWKMGKYEQRFSSGIVETTHEHQALDLD
jgi:high-affinity nickel-transport protein